MEKMKIEKINNITLNNSIPIVNNPNILEKIIYFQTYSYENNKKNLSKNLIKEMERIFGNSNKSLRLEFLTKVWILKYDDIIFNLFTAKNKGTSIEIVGYNHEDIRKGVKEKEIINFIEELYNLINY